MKVHELIKTLVELGDPLANVVVSDKNDAMLCITGVDGLYGDPNGDLYVTLKLDEEVQFNFPPQQEPEKPKKFNWVILRDNGFNSVQTYLRLVYSSHRQIDYEFHRDRRQATMFDTRADAEAQIVKLGESPYYKNHVADFHAIMNGG